MLGVPRDMIFFLLTVPSQQPCEVEHTQQSLQNGTQEEPVAMEIGTKLGRKHLAKLARQWESRRSRKKRAKHLSRAAW